MKILFMGRKKYAAQMLEWTVQKGVTVVAVVTDSQFPNSPTMRLAQKFGIPVISLHDAENRFRENPEFADLVVSYLFWQRINDPLIHSPQLGCINFHPAILPDWRGCGGYNIAILKQLTEWGATAHFVNEEIDGGTIIKVFKFSFDHRLETAKSLEEKTQKIQCDLYKSILNDLIEGVDLTAKVKPNVGGAYISKRQMLDMMHVDSEKDDIDAKIRAFWFPPYSGAYVVLQGKQYTLVNEFVLSQLKEEDQTSL